MSFFVVPAPGHYGDRDKVYSSHRTLAAAKRAAGPGYAVYEGEKRKGEKWLRAYEETYRRADAPANNPTLPEFFIVGRRVTIITGAGDELDVSDAYVLVADPQGDNLYFASIIEAAPTKGASSTIRAAWSAWTRGQEIHKAHKAAIIEPLDEQATDECWDLAALLYDGVLAGKRCRRIHGFRRPLPAFCARKSKSGAQLWIARRESRYCVTSRGIVG